jgi:peptidoglycan/LPS O-acetylase OafA/YrhL
MAEKVVQQKIIAIDIVRALAALGVFYYHNHAGGLLAKYSHLSFLRSTDAFGAIYAVPLFFLISGYCIHASNIKYLRTNGSLPLKEYYIRRFLRIYPPYFVALFFALLVNYLATPNYSVNTTDFLVHLFSLQGFTVAWFNTINIVLWTISVEIAFYIIYPVFYYIRYKSNLNYALAFAFLVSCLSIGWYMYRGGITLPERFSAFNLWFAWCCGAFLADKKTLNPGDLKKPVYLVVYMVILAGFICLNYIPNSLAILFDQFNVLFWTAPMLYILSKEDWLRKRKNLWLIRIMAAIGLSSYSLYLLHEPLIFLKNFLVHKYFSASFQPAGVALGVLIVPMIAWVSYYFVERPFISKKRKLQ